jgi:SAM-dependent methyltransferase
MRFRHARAARNAQRRKRKIKRAASDAVQDARCAHTVCTRNLFPCLGHAPSLAHMAKRSTAAPPRIFDMDVYRAHRERAAAKGGDIFLAEAAAKAMAERLAAVNRRFSNAVDIGSRDVAPFRDRADNWVTRELSDAPLNLGEAQFDLATSVLALHAVNDLPGVLIQIRRALKPDGLFMAALFGGDTLNELRAAFTSAEAEVWNGVSPRVAPFADVRDLGGLLQRAGFALPVADAERTTVRYGELATLLADLRALGETNALAGRNKRFLSRQLLGALLGDYKTRFADAEGRMRATFDIVYLTGWAPHESQQKALKPGSAKKRLAEALGTNEQSAGEKPKP